MTSAHLPFTEEKNRWGRIDGAKVLRALKKACDKTEEPHMPEPAGVIYTNPGTFCRNCFNYAGFYGRL
jgi:hypothetical protein